MDPKKKTFPKTLAVRRRKLKPGASQKRHLSSRKIPHSSDIFSDHLTRKDRHRVSDQWRGRAHLAWVCLLVHTSCLPPTHKPHVWTLKMNSGDTGTSLFVSLTNVARMNTSACSVFHYRSVSSAAQLRTS